MPTKDEKLYIVMVGLPSQGKSTVAYRLKDIFTKNDIPTRIFNNGQLRRQYARGRNTWAAQFYHPDNEEAMKLRRRFALINLRRARHYVNTAGEVAILDATNVSAERRRFIEEALNDHPILFIECVNNDCDIVEMSICQKVRTPEFASLSETEAIAEFKKRIDYYKLIYAPLGRERNYIRMDSLHNKILNERLTDQLPLYSRIRDCLVTDVVRSLYLIRHTETYFNVEDRIGGDAELTPKGIEQAKALARFFQRKKISYIFTSEKRRTIQTAEIIKELQQDCTIVHLKEFNEIDSGVCEGMSYDEIQRLMPEVYSARKADKYNYEYPGGEGYNTMKERIKIGIKKAFYLNQKPDNIMIIGHRAVNRMILSHFLYRRQEDVPYIYVPQNKLYHIVATQDRKLFELLKYC
ncbi:MAG TPA: 6-phosphofructo-2-kinase/fructose-2,6-bisphosphatase [Deltaproteobacteria bacterium]|nr:6-phosphofructo-2-kinase/fructose-2,6-bisphosphatase [Deltaproteobacteria bacterium]HOI07886.1 6-phosphofructo-2-kinase/fructose-2,6-bisphosphatase [Deltaproteobacteria bacterium]